MIARLAGLAALVLSAGAAEAQPRPSLYVEGGGASGLYAVGVEQTVFTSASGMQRFGVRAGAGYWTDRPVFFEGRQAYLSAPLGATVSFQLGRLPARLEATSGVVLGYERNTIAVRNGSDRDVSALPFAEVALRAALTRRVFARGGAVVGGRHDYVTGGAVAPVLGVGVQL